MSHLHPGAALKRDMTEPLQLVGTWSVWSQAADCPGAYFLAPADAAARGMGLKYVVIKALMGRTAIEPKLSLIRSDPPRPDLITSTKGTRR